MSDDPVAGWNRVVGGDNAAVHGNQCVFADLDAAVAVDDHVGTEEDMRREANTATPRVQEDPLTEFPMGADRDFSGGAGAARRTEKNRSPNLTAAVEPQAAPGASGGNVESVRSKS